MPNTKSAERRTRANEKKRLHNRSIKSRLRKLERSYETSLKSGNKEEATQSLRVVHSALDKAVKSGHWPLMRFNPTLIEDGKNPLSLDSRAPSIAYADYAMGENRWRTLKGIDPERAQKLGELAQKDASLRYHVYEQLAKLSFDNSNGDKDSSESK